MRPSLRPIGDEIPNRDPIFPPYFDQNNLVFCPFFPHSPLVYRVARGTGNASALNIDRITITPSAASFEVNNASFRVKIPLLQDNDNIRGRIGTY